MKTLGVLGAIAVAMAAQLTLARFAIVGGRQVDLVLVVVIFVALQLGPLAGLAAGSVAGLVQDVLSGSLVGVGGLATSVVAFGAGLAGQQFIVAHWLPRFTVFWLATVVQAACVLAIYGLLEPNALRLPAAAVVTQAFGNGLAGVLAFGVAGWLPGLVDRRRARRRAARRW